MRKKLLSVVYLLGFLVSIVVMAVLVNDSWESLMLHWKGDTAEATVVQPIRKSRVQVQFTDASGKVQQAVISADPADCCEGRSPARRRIPLNMQQSIPALPWCVNGMPS